MTGTMTDCTQATNHALETQICENELINCQIWPGARWTGFS